MIIKRTVCVLMSVFFILSACLSVFADDTIVSDAVMRHVYTEVSTPHKYGVVLKAPDGGMLDSPSVFRYDGAWYMMYIHFEGNGYSTRLAKSDDLLDWRPLGTILARGGGGWDTEQAAGYIALQDPEWGGSYELGTHDDRYWLSYLGGALTGYETEPLSVGMASALSPDAPETWTRYDGNPVLSSADSGIRWWEKSTLYKSHVLYDAAETLGHPFVMYYNAKSDGVERIGMAVSDNMTTWERFGTDPVIDNGTGISGDPQIVRLGDVWVMFYFGAFWRAGAFDTFACSRDLVNWTKWSGPNLVEPSEPWDAQYAHKPWIIKHDGVVYHFYCAVGDKGRVIALATSENMR